MKRVVLTLVVVFIASFSFAQSGTVNNFFSKYKEDRDVKYVSIKGSLFKFLESVTEEVEDDDAQMIGRIAEGINGVEILSVPKYETEVSKSEIDALFSGLKKDNYEELMYVKEGRKTVRVYASNKNSKVTNMLIVADEKDELALINIDGSIDLKDVSTFMNHSNKWKD